MRVHPSHTSTDVELQSAGKWYSSQHSYQIESAWVQHQMQWKPLLWSLNSALNLLLYCTLTVWSLHWDFFIFWSSNEWNWNLIEIPQWSSTLICVVTFLITVVTSDIELVSVICRLFCKLKLSIILALCLLLTECMTVVQIRFQRSFLFVRRLR